LAAGARSRYASSSHRRRKCWIRRKRARDRLYLRFAVSECSFVLRGVRLCFFHALERYVGWSQSTGCRPWRTAHRLCPPGPRASLDRTVCG
jgi:hypothetical protein